MLMIAATGIRDCRMMPIWMVAVRGGEGQSFQKHKNQYDYVQLKCVIEQLSQY